MTSGGARDRWAEDMQPMRTASLYVEWDEPGAGSICHIDTGKPVLHFGIDTDWSDPDTPVVSEDGKATLLTVWTAIDSDEIGRLAADRDAAVARADRAEAALALYGRTGGECWSEKIGGRGMCTRRAGHDGAHGNWSGGDWLTGPRYEERPSPWTADLLAALAGSEETSP